jgi:hypothetical protein
MGDISRGVAITLYSSLKKYTQKNEEGRRGAGNTRDKGTGDGL